VAEGDDEARVGRFQLPATSLARQPAARILTDPRVDWALVALTAADFAQGLAFDRCTACYLTPLPDADLDGRAQLVRQARLMTEEVADTLILHQRDAARWGRHLDLSCRRVITLVSDGLPDGTSEALQLSGGNLFHHHDGRCDRWLSLDGTVAEGAEALLLTAACLLAAGQHPREIADALAIQF
jgi:hypothetical protein